MNRQVVRVRADFDVDGKPNPLKMKYITEEQELSTVKIDRIIKTDSNNYAGNKMLIYFCESHEGNLAITFELRYEIESCKWFLYR